MILVCTKTIEPTTLCYTAMLSIVSPVSESGKIKREKSWQKINGIRAKNIFVKKKMKEQVEKQQYVRKARAETEKKH